MASKIFAENQINNSVYYFSIGDVLVHNEIKENSHYEWQCFEFQQSEEMYD